MSQSLDFDPLHSPFATDGRWPTLPLGPAVPLALGGQPEDFVVEELDAYPASGNGDHLFVRLRKRGLSTVEVTRLLAEHCGVGTGEIGFAGRKDAAGLTTQRFSLPRQAAKVLEGFAASGLEILEIQAHNHKLRMGHLAGNRFALRLQACPADAQPDLRRRLGELSSRGLPNYYGPQRFGADLRSAADGLQLLLRGRGRHRRRADDFLISALQSALFNDYLALRMSHDELHRALDGDVLQTGRGGLFVCNDAAVDTVRVQQGEVRVTGPMFGRKMMSPSGTSLTRESEILTRHDLTPAHFSSFKPPIPGTRRPLLIALEQAELEFAADHTALRFGLPSGSYATELCRQLLQTPVG